MDLGLTDRVYLVTGGARGLGRATAEVLVAEGARVVLSGRTEETLASAVRDLGDHAAYVVGGGAADGGWLALADDPEVLAAITNLDPTTEAPEVAVTRLSTGAGFTFEPRRSLPITPV